MKTIILFIIAAGILACNLDKSPKTGSYSGTITRGYFSDDITIEIEDDSSVFFTSLEQNANRIPFQNVVVDGDSIIFMLQSDFYTYNFKNKWTNNNDKLVGSLIVDTVTVNYTLIRQASQSNNTPESEEISFKSNGLKLHGTIWYPENKSKKGLVIVTSSGNADRSSSRAEATLLARKGFTTFHYDKQGTGNSEGNWESATMEELLADDIKAISYFSEKTGIPLNEIGVKGSSQGATKIPYLLNNLKELAFGIAVSCPGTTLLESDLNYWKNRNAGMLGNNLDDATVLQRNVFEYVAGKRSKTDLEFALDKEKSQSWFSNVWIPNLDETQTDEKLNFSPIPYFETTQQPILILQGALDEIIPDNSHRVISNSLKQAGNNNFKVVVLDDASHSMNYVGKSDFPYWSKLHPDYFKTMEEWIN